MADRTEKRDDLNRRINEMVALSDADYEQWQGLYRDGRNYIWNNQLANIPAKQGWPRVSANYLFPAAMQELAVIAQRRPKMQTKPHERGDKESVVPWAEILQWHFDKGLNMPHLLQRCSLDGKSAGHYAVKVYWESRGNWSNEERRWLGNVRADTITPKHLVIDPYASVWNEAAYVGNKRPVRVEYAKMRWPKYKDEIDKAATEEADEEATTKTDELYISEAVAPITQDGASVRGESGGRAVPVIEGRLANLLESPGLGLTTASQAVAGRSQAETEKPRDVTILELWFNDPAEEEITETRDMPIEDLMQNGGVTQTQRPGPMGEMVTMHTLPDGQPLQQGVNWPKLEESYTRPKYPFGRFIQRVGKDTIIRDEPWPLRYWPIVIGQNIELPNTWHGCNGVEMGRGLQDWVNVTLMHMAMYVMYFGDPKVVCEQDVLVADPSGKNPQGAIASRAGAVHQVGKNKLDKIKWVDPPSMSNGVPQFYSVVTQELQEQTGVHEVMRGASESKRQTAYELSRLEENSRMRVSLQAQLLDRFTIEVMYRVVEIIQHYMEPGQSVRIIGEGQEQGMIPLSQAMIDARFDIDLDVGRALPHDDEREQMRAKELFEAVGMPVIDKLLTAYDVKDKDEVMLKIDAAAFMEQVSAAMQKGPAGLPELQAILQNFVQNAAQQVQAEQANKDAVKEEQAAKNEGEKEGEAK